MLVYVLSFVEAWQVIEGKLFCSRTLAFPMEEILIYAVKYQVQASLAHIFSIRGNILPNNMLRVEKTEAMQSRALSNSVRTSGFALLSLRFFLYTCCYSVVFF